MSCVPPFGPVSEQLLLHIAAPDRHVRSIDCGKIWTEYVAQRGSNFGPVCLVPAKTTTMFSESTSLRSWLLRRCQLRAGVVLL